MDTSCLSALDAGIGWFLLEHEVTCFVIFNFPTISISVVFCRELRFPGVEPWGYSLKLLHYVMLSKPWNLLAKHILGPKITVKSYSGLGSLFPISHIFSSLLLIIVKPIEGYIQGK